MTPLQIPADRPVIEVDHEGHITAFNESASELYGYAAGEIVGSPLHVVYPLGPTGWPSHPFEFGHGADRIDSIEALHKTRDGRFVVVDLAVHRRRDGAENGSAYSVVINRVSGGMGAAGGDESAEAGQRWTLAVVETAVESIVTIDERGTIDYFNPAAAKLFGYSREEVVGKNIKMLMPDRYAREHDGYIENYLRTGKRKIIGIGRDVVGLRKDGSTFPMHLAVSEVWIGNKRIFTGIIHDRTETKREQEEKDRLLRELNRRNRELTCLYRLGEVVRTSELDGRMFADASELIHSAISLPAVTGTRITFDGKQYCTEPFQETPWSISADITAEGKDRGAVEVFYLEGRLDAETELTLESEQSLIDTVARVLGGAIERREAEAKVIHASKLASVGELAAGVGHEINNPVNGIINCAQILYENSEPDSKNREFAQLIQTEGERIAKIVQSLLTYSRQEKDQHSLARVEDIVDVVMSLCGKKLSKSHINLQLDLDRDLPRFRCRSEQLQQVLMNLVLNAMHALDDRYPGADANKILKISARYDGAHGSPVIRLTVEDRGTGIPPAHVERIFDPFFTTKGRDKGTGLGLSVSDGMVKDHGGSISVESELGEFTRFIVELPARSD